MSKSSVCQYVNHYNCFAFVNHCVLFLGIHMNPSTHPYIEYQLSFYTIVLYIIIITYHYSHQCKRPVTV